MLNADRQQHSALSTHTLIDTTHDAQHVRLLRTLRCNMGAMMTANQTILIAEGDGGVAERLGRAFQQDGFTVVIACDGPWRSIWCALAPSDGDRARFTDIDALMFAVSCAASRHADIVIAALTAAAMPPHSRSRVRRLRTPAL